MNAKERVQGRPSLRIRDFTGQVPHPLRTASHSPLNQL
jgi:hypothetical protein